MFEIADLQTILLIYHIDVIMIFPYAKFYLPRSSGSLVIAIRLKCKEVYVTTMLVYEILQRCYLTVFFQSISCITVHHLRTLKQVAVVLLPSQSLCVCHVLLLFVQN
jgi:hypothetical protein